MAQASMQPSSIARSQTLPGSPEDISPLLHGQRPRPRSGSQPKVDSPHIDLETYMPESSTNLEALQKYSEFELIDRLRRQQSPQLRGLTPQGGSSLAASRLLGDPAFASQETSQSRGRAGDASRASSQGSQRWSVPKSFSSASVSRHHQRMQEAQADGSQKEVPPLFLVGADLLKQAAQVTVKDSFSQCFVGQSPKPWNWTWYLMPAWILGVIMRYFVLFPMRLCIFFTGFIIFILGFVYAKTLHQINPLTRLCCTRATLEQQLIKFMCATFVASWSGVVRFHGVRPKPIKDQVPGVFVSNHSSMIDFIILEHADLYAVLGQQHKGWVAWWQNAILSSIDCIWFDRGSKDKRHETAERIKNHATDPTKVPMLVFPEGTCVNNEYVLQFKQFVFTLGVPINPIAIRYNKIFVDGYWNSRQQSFQGHLFSLMTSWAVVCDVHFLPPMAIRKGEDPSEFAARVQRRIANKIGLKAMPWDGYMKYWAPSERFMQARRAAIAEDLLAVHGMGQPELLREKEEEEEEEAAEAREEGGRLNERQQEMERKGEEARELRQRMVQATRAAAVKG